MTNLLNDIKRAGAVACVLAASAAGAATANAESVNLGELQNGVAYEYSADGFPSVEATFTVIEDGAVRVLCSGTDLFAYDSAEHNEEGRLDSDHSYVNGGSMATYQCKAGDVIYLYNSFVMTSGTVTVTNGTVEMKLVSEAPSLDPESKDYYGGYFTVSSNYTIGLSFNVPVSVGGATLTANGVTRSVSCNTYGMTASLDVAATIMDLYNTAGLKRGDKMTVSLTGVAEKDNAENMINGDGNVSIEYVMDNAPVMLQSTVNTPDSGVPSILSWYAPGSPESVVELIFSGDIALSEDYPATVRLSYGDVENLELGMYYENITPVFEGNTLKIDLSGKLRRPVDMLPGIDPESAPDYINMTVYHVYGADGQRAYTGVASNPYNYNFNYTIDVLSYNVVSDFTPSASKGLVEGNELEIYIMNGSMVSFEGVNFAYTDGQGAASVTVPFSEVKYEVDEFDDNDRVITLAVPALPGITETSDVVVTLSGMSVLDGLNHEDDVKCTYSSYTAGISSVTADADGSYEVYNAQGIRLLSTASKAQVKTLPAGLYIVNGQKVIVK